MIHRVCCLLCLAAVSCLPARAEEKAASALDIAFFESHIRPLLVQHCLECHGAVKPKADLRLDSRTAMLQGGNSGEPAVVPGNPAKSMLLRAVRHAADAPKMPPKAKLKPAEIADLTTWIQNGAVYPESKPAIVATAKHWAFQPLQRPALPAIRNPQSAIHNDIDRFVLAQLEAKGLQPAPPADRRTLIRRATFDLIGLPPTPAEVEAFVNDPSPHAFARVVDRLLASPHYGERWGRHWLDLTRYADSNGMDENLVYANAWRYRDYVIQSFNADKPYNQFVREQIAGDLLSPPQLTATGFLVIGPKMLAEDDPVKMEMDIIDEQVDTIGRTFLGMTLGCARCHDHKYDPVSLSDYYALAGIFKSTKTMDNFKVVASWHERPVSTPAEQQQAAQHQQRIAELQKRIADGDKLGAKAEAARLRDELKKLEKTKPPIVETMAVAENTTTELRVHLRGNHLTLGKVVARGFPRSLLPGTAPPIPAAQSGRLQLADWLTQPEHPLTARVLVNRVWRWHFGSGIVASADNFGILGTPPSHPELLDWLALRFVEDGWSLKKLHRLILTSATWQQSSNPQSAIRNPQSEDPDNRLLWRVSRRRLEAEAIRDSLLAVSGQLDTTMGGSLFNAKNRSYVPGYPNGNYEKYDFPRRSVYLPVLRSMLYDVFQAFDFPDPSVANGERASTTVAPQALFMMNSKLVQDATRQLAAALLRETGDDAQRLRTVYVKLYSRPPTAAEAERVLAFLTRLEQARSDRPAEERRLLAWQSVCRVLLSANEFVYVE